MKTILFKADRDSAYQVEASIKASFPNKIVGTDKINIKPMNKKPTWEYQVYIDTDDQEIIKIAEWLAESYFD